MLEGGNNSTGIGISGETGLQHLGPEGCRPTSPWVSAAFGGLGVPDRPAPHPAPLRFPDIWGGCPIFRARPVGAGLWTNLQVIQTLSVGLPGLQHINL